MTIAIRGKKRITLTIDGNSYPVEILEIPFREGVEARCQVRGKEFRVSDRGLGEHEALRLLEEEVRASSLTLKSTTYSAIHMFHHRLAFYEKRYMSRAKRGKTTNGQFLREK